MLKVSDTDTCGDGEEAQICNLQYFSQARCTGCRTAWAPEAKSLSCPQMRLYLLFICTCTCDPLFYLPFTIFACHMLALLFLFVLNLYSVMIDRYSAIVDNSSIAARDAHSGCWKPLLSLEGAISAGGF